MMMVLLRSSVILFFLTWVFTVVQGSTWFEAPTRYTKLKTGEMMMIRLMSDKSAPIGGEIQLVDQNGYFPRDLGKIGLVNHPASVLETTNGTNGLVTRMTSTYSFKLWDQLPEGDRYQLVFLPFSAAHGSNAVSYYFAVAKSAC